MLLDFGQPYETPKGLTELHVTMPGFTPDLMHLGHYFVSAAWREAAQLSDAEAVYFDIDDTHSSAEVQAMDYKLLHPAASRNWADPEASGVEEYPPSSNLLEACALELAGASRFGRAHRGKADLATFALGRGVPGPGQAGFFGLGPSADLAVVWGVGGCCVWV